MSEYKESYFVRMGKIFERIDLSEAQAIETLKDFMKNPDDYFSTKYPHIPLKFYDSVKYAIEKLDQPTLNENQQIVLEHLKKMCPPKLDVSAMVTVYCLVDDNINDNWQEYSEKIPGHIEALQKLTITEENQVLQAFASWVLEQEEE